MAGELWVLSMNPRTPTSTDFGAARTRWRRWAAFAHSRGLGPPTHHPRHPAASGPARFRQAGIDGTRAKGALLHGLRHTFATELANADVSVYVLMNLLGHESMTTSQRYISAAGTDT